MAISTYRPLPSELAEIQATMEAHATHYGLDFFPTIFEMLDYEELSMFAAYGGFPTRYPHWRFGAQYDELMKGYSYGLQKIYEMVINTDPCYAYLLSCNSLTDQKLVIAHVYGHCDFFKNNAWFSRTNRKMLDQMANHGARVRRYIDRFGHDKIEEFIDACLSLEDLIDMYSPHIQRTAQRNKTLMPKELKPVRDEKVIIGEQSDEVETDDDHAPHAARFATKDYLDPFVNPRAAIDAEEQELKKKAEESRGRSSFPEEPQRDVLLFLLEHAPLQQWQHDILSIIRDEAYYFAPQGQTKIMNEGWASFWHSTIMTHHGVTDADFIDYADHHSGTMATSRNQLNPYKLGIELLRDIEERWNKGQFGPEWENCDDLKTKLEWDKQMGLGRQKIFEVRRVHNDVTFIDNFLTPEFCIRQNLFQYRFNEDTDYYEIASREFAAIKRQLLDNLTNHGRPFIYVQDGNYRNRGELYLTHRYQGVELKQDYAQDTLANLQKLWNRPVHIETVVDDKPTVLSYDGHSHEKRERVA